MMFCIGEMCILSFRLYWLRNLCLSAWDPVTFFMYTPLFLAWRLLARLSRISEKRANTSVTCNNVFAFRGDVGCLTVDLLSTKYFTKCSLWFTCILLVGNGNSPKGQIMNPLFTLASGYSQDFSSAISGRNWIGTDFTPGPRPWVFFCFYFLCGYGSLARIVCIYVAWSFFYRPRAHGNWCTSVPPIRCLWHKSSLLWAVILLV